MQKKNTRRAQISSGAVAVHLGHRTRTGSPAVVAVGCDPLYSVLRTKLSSSLEMHTHHWSKPLWNQREKTQKLLPLASGPSCRYSLLSQVTAFLFCFYRYQYVFLKMWTSCTSLLFLLMVHISPHTQLFYFTWPESEIALLFSIHLATQLQN